MREDLSFKITHVEHDAGYLQVTVEWSAKSTANERELLLVDTLTLPTGIDRGGIEAAVLERARSFVRPRYFDARPAPKPEHLALVGKERLVSELEGKP